MSSRLCVYPLCPTPMQPLERYGKYYHKACWVAYRRRYTKHQRRRVEGIEDDPPEVIERNFQNALAEIKRRPRMSEVSWPSSMAGWTL